MNKKEHREYSKIWYKNNKERRRRYRRIWRKKNILHIRLYNKIWKKAHPENSREYYRQYHKKYAQTLNGKYIGYKKSARIRKFEFNLTKNQFASFWQKPCYYCGNSIETIGLDRVRNNEGYTMSNVVSCCDKCNKMKHILGKDDFLNHCKKVAQFQEKR